MKLITSNLTNECSGVYKITDTNTLDFYIGSSRNIKKRYKQHVYNLKRDDHANYYLSNIKKKYGINIFTFEVIEFCSISEILNREQYYIDKLNPKFNIIRDVTMATMTDEIKKKISDTIIESFKNGRKRPLNLSQRRAVIKYSIKGEYIEKYSSLKEAAKSINVTRSSIYTSCRNNNRLSGGYKWQYENDPFNYIPPIVIVDLLSNKRYNFETFSEAEKKMGINKGVIARTLHNWGNGIIYKDRYSFHDRNLKRKIKKLTWIRKEPKYNKILL